MRGWISPDDRLWRHPSESGTPATGPSTIQLGTDKPAGRTRSGPWIVGGTTACIVLALVAAGLVIATTGTTEQDNPSITLTAAPTTEPGAKQAVGMATVAAMVSSIRPSIVVMVVVRSTGTSVSTGLVAESGGIIVTTSEALSGAIGITVIEPGGSRRVAELIGVDQPSGLGVVRISDDLPAASFDSNDPAKGTAVIAMALEPGQQPTANPTPVVYAGTVVSAGQAVSADRVTTTFAGVAVEAPLSHDALGCPLLDNAGHVSGLLEKTVQSGGSTVSVFLPAALVLGVTRQLVQSGTMVHGWLGVDASNATSAVTTSTNSGAPSAQAGAGARLDSVDTGSPAAIGGMAPGDIITGIDGYRVQSKAELETRLYPDGPGTNVLVTFSRGGASMSTPVVLASADTDVQGGQSSP
jgi:putative serine protease PepD